MSDNNYNELEAELRRMRRDEQARVRAQGEPDWSTMQMSIRQAIAAEPLPRLPWWRRWSVLVPVTGTLVASAAAAALWIQARPAVAPEAVRVTPDAGTVIAPAPTIALEPVAPLVLDGEDLDVASIDEADLDAAIAAEQPQIAGDDSNAPVGSDALVPSSLQWVDTLAADDLDALDQWLDAQVVKKG